MLTTPEFFAEARVVNNWLIVHELHYNDAFNWNLAWDEYKSGFGTLGSNYWFGLERLHTLTVLHPYRVRIEVHRIPQNVTLWLEMNVFAVANESQGYQLTWSGMSGSVELTTVNTHDTMTYHNGRSFATYDKDNLNCALSRGAGWWFNYCATVCVTCVSYKPMCPGTNSGYDITGTGVCADQSVMMIRPA
jgi:Fibrinogen beta and gamma chains, C-terminal globular domain